MSKQKELRKAKREYFKLKTISVSLTAALITTPLVFGIGGTGLYNYHVEERRGIPAFNDQDVKGYEGVRTTFHSNGIIEKQETTFPHDQLDYVSYQSTWQEIEDHDHYNIRSFTQDAVINDLVEAINKNMHYERFIDDPSTLESFLRNSEEEEQLLKVENVEDYLAKEGVFSITSHQRISDERVWVQTEITGARRGDDVAKIILATFLGALVSMLIATIFEDSLKRLKYRSDDAASKLRQLQRKEVIYE